MKPNSGRQTAATVPPTPSAAATAVWTDLVELWTGRRRAEEAQPLIAGAAHAMEHGLRACRAMLAAHRAAMDAMYDAARRQQELGLIAVQTTCAAFPIKAGSGGRQASATSSQEQRPAA